MSEVRSDFRPRPGSPAVPPRRAQAAARSGRARRTSSAIDPPDSGRPSDEPTYPLDPPLVDVRIPVKEPHAAATAYSRNALMHRFPSAQVGDDLHMLFSEPGRKLQSRLSPDVFVALGVPRRGTRADYDADLLGPPDFVLEVVSRSTWKHDLGRKLDCYQRLGVRECLLFDATGEDLAGMGKALWGFALTPKRREPLREEALPNGERGVRSEVLGLVAYVAERTPPAAPGEIWALTMRWRDPATGADIPDYDQARDDAQAAQANAQAARADAQAARADAQAARAEAQAARAWADAQARAERNRADAAQRETQTERARVETARRRIAELEEQLRRLRDRP